MGIEHVLVISQTIWADKKDLAPPELQMITVTSSPTTSLVQSRTVATQHPPFELRFITGLGGGS